MKISLNWVKEYIDLGDLPAAEIIHTLNMLGLEVEDSVDQNELYKGFVVGHVKEKQKHPNADKLSLCIVDSGKEYLSIVCGAPNVAAGQKIVFAPIGTEIPKGKFKITKAKIRGIESFGMICSDDELELSDDHAGIKVLDNDIKTGLPITEALGLNDIILDIGITPNRTDALSHIGIARDLSAYYGKKLCLPEINISVNKSASFEKTSVKILDTLNCPRYSAKIVRGLTVKDSPDWLKNKITGAGLRPINNIVDATNFVMYECGQPLHAFDIDLLQGKSIVVQPAEKKSFTTLDGKTRALNSSILMICDAEKEVAIAGLMGGENSEIKSVTKNILIESAYFNPSSIRKTAKSLGLSTEASYRFERGTDPNQTVFAAERAAKIIAEIAGGTIEDVILDIYPAEIESKIVTLRFERIKRILGYEIPKSKVSDILNALGFEIVSGDEDFIKIKIPTFRPDVEREIDLIEEVARVHGFDNIPAVHKISISLGDRGDEGHLIDELRNISSSLGLYEMINNPMQSETLASLSGAGIQILNPLSLDMAYLRTSLLPGALTTVAMNINRGEKNLSLFEIGNVFKKLHSDAIKSFDDFSEETNLLVVLTGNETEKTWNNTGKSYDYFSLKGMVENIASKISLDNVLNDSYYIIGNTIYDYYFEKNWKNRSFGQGGKISASVLKQFDIQQDVFCFNINADVIQAIKTESKYYKEPAKYPKMMRDFAFIFDNIITYDEVKEFIKVNSTDILRKVELFDIFESENLGSNKKSLAFALEYQSDSRTLTEEEVEKDFNGLIKSITKKFNAKLRGS